MLVHELMHGVGGEGAAALPYAQRVLASDAEGELGGFGCDGAVRTAGGGAEGEVGASEDGHVGMRWSVLVFAVFGLIAANADSMSRIQMEEVEEEKSEHTSGGGAPEGVKSGTMIRAEERWPRRAESDTAVRYAVSRTWIVPIPAGAAQDRT